MVKNLAYILGAILVLVGILGFFNDPVLGVFEVDLMHNLVHIITGLILVGVAAGSPQNVGMTALVLGIIYALVAVIGLFSGDTILGLFEANFADDILHILLAVILIVMGVMGKKQGASISSMPAQPPQQPPVGGPGVQM